MSDYIIKERNITPNNNLWYLKFLLKKNKKQIYLNGFSYYVFLFFLCFLFLTTETRCVLYEPQIWNQDEETCSLNYCYNYANNIITNSMAQPGRGSGRPYYLLDDGTLDHDNVIAVGEASIRDGEVLMPISADDGFNMPTDGHIIALFIWPGFDYHWYRLDSNGRWSHKSGERRATDRDNAGSLINDPRDCDRGPYTDFIGFYHCIPENLTIF